MQRSAIILACFFIPIAIGSVNCFSQQLPFVHYTPQNGLANNVVNDILEVGDDSLLVATNSNVVNVLVKGKIGKLITEGFRCPLVNQFCRNDDGKIYLSSDDGLFVL